VDVLLSEKRQGKDEAEKHSLNSRKGIAIREVAPVARVVRKSSYTDGGGLGKKSEE